MKIIYGMDMDLEYPMKQEPATRKTSLSEQGGWQILTIQDRVDAFNTEQLIAEIESIVDSENPFLILNLETTSFISIPFIKKMTEWSAKLRRQGIVVVLLKPSEKIKRQIDIFASLEDFHVSRREQDLPIKAEI